MKLFLTIAFFSLTTALHSQSIIGKWKPVFFSLDSMVIVDVNTDSIYMSPAFREELKKDKDSQASEEMIKLIADLLLKKLQVTEEEYLDNGVFKENNTRNGKVNTGTYIFNSNKNTLTRNEESGNTRTFQVNWLNGQLLLSSDLKSSTGKEGKLKVIYKKL